MDATYVCWQAPNGASNWTVYRIEANGRKQIVESFSRYLDAARLLQSLRQQAAASAPLDLCG